MESNIVNTRTYIQMSKTNIDNFIYKNEYKKAFSLLILVLERLDNDEKEEMIAYMMRYIHR